MKIDCFSAEEAELSYKLLLAVACNSSTTIDPDPFRKICDAMIALKPLEGMTKWIDLLQRMRVSSDHAALIATARQWVDALPEDHAAITMLTVVLYMARDSEYKRWYSKVVQLTKDPVYLAMISHIPLPNETPIAIGVKPVARKLVFR
jgi:hypothetical protein